MSVPKWTDRLQLLVTDRTRFDMGANLILMSMAGLRILYLVLASIVDGV